MKRHVHDSVEEELQCLLPNPNAPLAVSKGSKTLHQQNPPVLSWRCWLMQVDLYNGCNMVAGYLPGAGGRKQPARPGECRRWQAAVTEAALPLPGLHHVAEHTGLGLIVVLLMMWPTSA